MSGGVLTYFFFFFEGDHIISKHFFFFEFFENKCLMYLHMLSISRYIFRVC